MPFWTVPIQFVTAQPYLGWIRIFVSLLLAGLVAAQLISVISDRNTCTDQQLAARVREKHVHAFSARDPNYQHAWREYYTQVAAHACTERNGWELTPCALRRRLARGIRALHMDLAPSNAAAPRVVHGTLARSMDFTEAWNICLQSAFHPRTSPNATDPLFLYLRVATPPTDPAVHRAMLDALVALFAAQRYALLGPAYSYQAVLRNEHSDRMRGATMTQLQHKLVLLANQSWIQAIQRDVPDHAILQYINLSVGSMFMEEFTRQDATVADLAQYTRYCVGAVAPEEAAQFTPAQLDEWRQQGGVQWIPMPYTPDRDKDPAAGVAAADAAVFRQARHAFVHKSQWPKFMPKN